MHRKKNETTEAAESAEVGTWIYPKGDRCPRCYLPVRGELAPYRLIEATTPITHRRILTCPVCGGIVAVYRRVGRQ